MNILWPRQRFSRITDIPVQSLQERGIRALILDVDNTMTTHDNPHPAEGVLDWLGMVQQAGIRCIILSNNSPGRVEPFARLLSLSYESDARKPLPGGFLRACERMRVLPRETASIGDQIFTDILGANCAGVYSIFVQPVEPESGWFFRFKRRLEGPILAGFERSMKR